MVFIPRRTIVCEKVLQDEGVYGDVSIGEFELDFIPFENDVISLELDAAFRVDFGLSPASKAAWPLEMRCFTMYQAHWELHAVSHEALGAQAFIKARHAPYCEGSPQLHVNMCGNKSPPESCARSQEVALEGDTGALFHTARALMRLQARYGEAGVVRGKGASAAVVNDIMTRMRQEQGPEASTSGKTTLW